MSVTRRLYSTDESALAGIRSNDEQALDYLYQKCRGYCLRFITSNGGDDETAADIYQDAVLVLWEKVRFENLQLTCSIQTYLNSICRYQWLDRPKRGKSVFFSNPEELEFVADLTDWFDDYETVHQQRLDQIMRALDEMEAKGGNCKELLHLFFYEKKTMEELAIHFNYTNAENAKVQKYKCQERLKRRIEAGS